MAGTTRARALARRRLGKAGARRVALAGSAEEVVAVLAATPYGHDVRAGQDLAEAQRAVLDCLLWHLRVLAGWLPAEGAAVIRLLARWFEIANVDAVLAGVAPRFDLGALATAWPRLRHLTAPAGIRAALAASPWGDPGGPEPRRIQLGMRLSWAAQVARTVRPASAWATAATALLVARERFLEGRRLHLSREAESLLGPRALDAGSLRDMTASLPSSARWVLAGLDRPGDLWRGEPRWWERVERDGTAMLSGSAFGPSPVVGAVALLAADAWRVQRAGATAVYRGDVDELA
ncbi:hypothetical protein GCM10009677_48750 [Sphaerisporangium rubeum]